MAQKENKVVFSTDTGDRRKMVANFSGDSASLPPAQQNLKIMRDNKGRAGKVVTVITGFMLAETDLKNLTKTLKTLCGAGGTVKEGGVIEIQGDHREKIAAKLRTLGYKVKLAGG
jgi:translation initiation factor 1